jgi:hypothetical protein
MLTYLKDIRSTSLRVGKASRIIAEVTSYILYSKGRFHACLDPRCKVLYIHGFKINNNYTKPR